MQWVPKDGAASNLVPDAHLENKRHAPIMFTTDLSLTPKQIVETFVSRWGLVAALVLFSIGSLWSWIAFRKGDRIVLRVTGAHPVTMEEEPEV